MYLLYFQVGNYFLDRPQKALTIKEKIDKLELLKLRTSVHKRIPLEKKRIPLGEEKASLTVAKIVATHITKKGLIPRI